MVFARKNGGVKAAVERLLRQRVELKEYSTTISISTLNTTGSLTTLNAGIPEGTEYNQRVGRKYNMKQIQVDWYVTMATANTTPDAGFVALVYDKNPQASSAAFSDIFDTSASPAGTALKNTIAEPSRFEIVWIDQFTLSNMGPQINKNRHYYKVKEHQMKVEYNTLSSATPTIGAWYLAYGCARNVAASMVPFFANFKVQYTDF